MRPRVHRRLLSTGAFAASLALGACASGTAGPPALAYGLPDPPAVAYAAGDSLSIQISALGQTLELTMNATASYDVAFAPGTGDGVQATLSVRDLQAQVSLPMAGPMTVDEEIVQGDLVLALGPRGDVTILESPVVEEAASLFFAGPTIAHSFFPALPGTAVRPGDTWVDTVSYADEGDTGESSQRSVLTYTVLADSLVAGRSLVEIGFEGSEEMRQTMAFQGADMEMETSLTVEGRVLWDPERGLMVERESLSRGTGTVTIATMGTPLPTRVETRSRVRLQPE